ncbi:hypothetical protein GIB67_031610 [Kingdonia uniflora]|uniref:RING-type domain-containing protein n=1 Tax=Kingdonia uniflora TaxID=39325 RepID=A0A7J7LYD6_9MAGN|nr:hypothetical protein GIB67_031610 [Kingdonia uniflora]
MGSSSSRLGSHPTQPRLKRTIRRTLSSLLCGSRTSPHHQMEEYPVGLLACSTEVISPIVVNQLQTSKSKGHSSVFSSESVSSRSTTERGTSSNSSIGASERKCLSVSKEVGPDLENADCTTVVVEPYLDKNGNVGSNSCKEQQSSQSVNVRDNLATDSVIDNTINEEHSQIYVEGTCSSSTTHQDHQDSCPDVTLPVENPTYDVLPNVDSSFVPVVSESTSTSQSLGNEIASLIIQETAPTVGLGLLMSDMHHDRRNGNVLHVDVVSISSNTSFSNGGEIGNHEARRNSRRLFWDAFSRRGSRRHSDSRTIFFSNEDIDDVETRDRWLLDFNNESFEDGVGSYSGFLSSRRHGMYEGRRHSRSEIWERFRGGLDESSRRTNFCASGLHPDGTCSCESFSMEEESSTRGSISRIVMLAEALFEVLDEIHRQPLSFSLSMVSRPAPEAVVNSFPLKSHKKPNVAEIGDDVEQCYICLAEYEEGDTIRILPCRHEYHMSCVDKWLKEIHGVCPLCRGDVSEGAAQCSVSNP